MAENNEIPADEAKELEKLLTEAEIEEAQSKFSIKKLLDKLLSNKKLLIIVSIGLLLLIAAIGVGVYFLTKESPIEAPIEEIQQQETIPTEDTIEKVYIYPLESFFLPIRAEETETGKFISVIPNLLLSNSALHKEVDKVLPLIRKNIYTILRRKNLHDYIDNKLNTEERLKQEILTTANALLLSGTGTITDVYFTQFIVK